MCFRRCKRTMKRMYSGGILTHAKERPTAWKSDVGKSMTGNTVWGVRVTF